MSDRQKTVGVLTGGGDVPGLNPALKTLVNRAVESGYRVLGIRRGWGGLLNFNREDPESLEKNIIPLDRQAVRTVDRTGGTFLHTSRTNPAKVSNAEVKVYYEQHRDKWPGVDLTQMAKPVQDILTRESVPAGGGFH